VSAYLLDCNAVCAVGRGAEQIWTSIRTGIGRIGDSGVMDTHFEQIPMGLVPEDALPPLPPAIDALPLPQRARRMLRLGAPTLASIAESAGPGPLRLFLGVPRVDAQQQPWISSFAIHLARMANLEIDNAVSRVIPAGRAGALMAFELALQALAADPTRRVIVGGIDTFLDPRLLAEFEIDGRLAGAHATEGFIPGEGAGFLVLGSAQDGAPLPGGRPVRVLGAATVRDQGHRSGSEPARGEGLAAAIEKLRGSLSEAAQPVATTFAGLNGEAFDAKLWGVAALRHRDLFAPNMQMQHPADCIGDTGAATGAILAVIATAALTRGQRGGPALLWAASDHEPRACVLLGS
jgi:3-oxoacyl-[acyl-carrier-protein] synthase-1